MSTIEWESLPAGRREAIELRTGPVVKAEPVTSGLMPGLAAVLHAGHRRYFLKAATADSPAHHLYRQELAANKGMPDGVPAPRMQYGSADHGWIVMLFDYLADARDADLSPGSPDLPRVVSMLRTISAAPAWDTTPPVAEHAAALQAKAAKMLTRLPAAELHGAYAAAVGRFDIDAIAGGRLVHYDLHPGNLKITRDGDALAVDWSFACAGATWVDAAFLVPRLIAAGHSPADAEARVSGLRAWQAAPDDAVTGLAALWTMFREYKAIYGPEESREFRALAASAGRSWLRYRMS